MSFQPQTFQNTVDFDCPQANKGACGTLVVCPTLRFGYGSGTPTKWHSFWATPVIPLPLCASIMHILPLVPLPYFVLREG